MKFELKKDLIKHELGDFARLIESQEGDLKLNELSFDEHLEYLLEACKQTYRVCYIRMPDLIRNFENHRDDLRELTKYRKRIGNYNILIIDEWLNYKLPEKDAKMLYELFEQRSGVNPTIFVGQFPVDEWHDRMGGGTQADSIMDRIVHNAYEIPSSDTNLRKIYDSKKLKKLVDEIEK